jgi:hypothetical protein
MFTLILVVLTMDASVVAVTSVPGFATQELCEQAGKDTVKQTRRRIEYSCVKTG